MKSMISAACVAATLLVALWSPSAHAKVHGKLVEYKDGDTVLEGYLSVDDAAKGKRPGILVVHAWMGLDDTTKKHADALAALGYVAFAADIYGKGLRPKDKDEAGKLAGTYKGNRALLRQRVTAALTTLDAQANVDTAKTAAIGYCFGGTTVLELARSGASVAGVVTFHGGLDSPTPADGKNIKSKVLVLHGAADPFSSPTDIAAFQKELADNKVDWQMEQFGGAVHCFTDSSAGSDTTHGCAYDAVADRRSWAAMKSFFDELFAAKK